MLRRLDSWLMRTWISYYMDSVRWRKIAKGRLNSLVYYANIATVESSVARLFVEIRTAMVGAAGGVSSMLYLSSRKICGLGLPAIMKHCE
jgi:hypothetical protein